jgi:cyclic pyranopterin phosphate synthase
MVDVSAKSATTRVAIASGEVSMLASTADTIRQAKANKGDVLGVARLAAISAAKWTSHLIPLCHAIPIEAVAIEFAWQPTDPNATRHCLVCKAQVTTSAKTGVEMEAMTAVSIALLTVYDMLKSVDRAMELGPIRLDEKSGGKSGHFLRKSS